MEATRDLAEPRTRLARGGTTTGGEGDPEARSPQRLAAILGEFGLLNWLLVKGVR